jgi:hypothetical protein
MTRNKHRRRRVGIGCDTSAMAILLVFGGPFESNRPALAGLRLSSRKAKSQSLLRKSPSRSF